MDLADLAYERCLRLVHAGGRVFGINGPQGSGKSTLAARLAARARADGWCFVPLSTDDLYLTHAEQRAVAAQHPGEALLQVRGGPGTHDVALGTRVLDALRAGAPVTLPRYDKSAHGGRGDRAAPALWPEVARADLVIFEGWTLGWSPIGTAGPGAIVDAFIADYAPWTDAVDGWLQLRTASFENVVAWRMEAEANRARERGADQAMTPFEAECYIRRFAPLYRRHPNTLTRRLGPEDRCVWLDPARSPTEAPG